MPSDEQALSDAELVALLEDDRTLGCHPWLLGPLLGAGLGSLWGLPAALLGALVALGLCALIQRLHERLPAVRRRRRAERELERRYGLAPLEHHEAEARAALEQPGGPEAVLLLQGRALPHGGHRFIRIDLADEPTVRARSTPFLHDLCRIEELQTRMRRIDAPLSAAGAERARALLRELTPEALPAAPHLVIDGFPCDAVVLRRDAEPLRASMNISGFPEELESHPYARLLRLMLELEAEVSGARGSSPDGC